MSQYILSWIIFLEEENFESFDIIKGPIFIKIAKINRASKIFAPPLLTELKLHSTKLNLLVNWTKFN